MMGQQRTIPVFNAGCQVERDGRLVEIQEAVPPYAVVVLGKPLVQADSSSRDQHEVFRARKPSASASLYRSEILAINGPAPIPYKGYGAVTQDWPALALVDLRDADGERVDLPLTHGSYGVRNDSWALQPNGGLFTNLGLDTTTAAELGGREAAAGTWSNLPAQALAWVRPRPMEPEWMTGWRTSTSFNPLPSEAGLDPYNPADDLRLNVEPRRSIKYRMQQPWVSGLKLGQERRLFEPIEDAIDHDPLAWERAQDPHAQADRAVRWVRVREAGTYLASFSARVTGSLLQEDALTSIGLFAAWPAGTGRTPTYQCIPWPAGVAYGRFLIVNDWVDDANVIWIGHGENISCTCVMELKADWAFGFIGLGYDYLHVQSFSCTVQRMGAAANVEQFWEKLANKIDYVNGAYAGEEAFLEDEPSDDPGPEVGSYPVLDPRSVVFANSDPVPRFRFPRSR